MSSPYLSLIMLLYGQVQASRDEIFTFGQNSHLILETRLAKSLTFGQTSQLTLETKLTSSNYI